jgi:hypothetical protein
MFNGNQVFRDLLPKLGKKEIDKYFVNIPPPPIPMQGGGGDNGAMAGKLAPQIGDNTQMPQNEIQQASMGGF